MRRQILRLHRLSSWVLVLFVTVLCLLAFEGATRLAGLKPGPHVGFRALPRNAEQAWSMPDPELGWVNKPGMARSSEPGNALMTFSADGSRASPLLQSKKEVPLRVLVVGDSFSQGHSVADDETFVHFLNERFPQIRFESFGTGGYNTLQSMMMAERVLTRWETQDVRVILVIYGFIYDHLQRNVGKWRQMLADSSGRHYISPPHARQRGRELDLQPYRELEPWPFERISVILSLLHKAWLRYGYDVTGSEALEVTNRLVERFAQTVRAHGSLPLLVALDGNRPIQDVIRAESVKVVDCTHPGWGTDLSLRTAGTTGHPTAKVHRYYADCIGDWIERQLDHLRS